MNKKLHYLLLVIAVLFLFGNNESAQAAGAPNIDMKEGFSGWEMWHGTFDRDEDSIWVYNWETKTEVSDVRITQINSDNRTPEPIIACNMQLNPFKDGLMPVRIGRPNLTRNMEGCEGFLSGNRRAKWAGADMAQYSFVVTEDTKALLLDFAAVLHLPIGKNAGEHLGDHMPYFSIEVEMEDTDGKKIPLPCGKVESNASTSGLLERNPSTCKESKAVSSSGTNVPDEYVYLPWTQTIYDLQDRIGYKVTITAKTHDCHVISNGNEVAGGHEAYGYLLARAVDLKLDVNNCKSDNSNPRIKAPEGFASYEWTINGEPNAMFKVLNEKGNEVEIARELMRDGVSYECTMRANLETCAPIVLKTNLDPVNVIPDMSYNRGCNGEVEFTNKSTAEGDDPLFSYNWSFGDSTTSVKENPTHVFSEPGLYKVRLTGTTKNGCSGFKDFNVRIPDFPTAILEKGDTLCKGDKLRLNAYIINDDYSIVWYDNQKNVIGNNTPILETDLERSEWIYAKVTDQFGCSVEDSTYVIIVPKPVLSMTVSPKDTICRGDSVVLRVNSGLQKCNFGWSTGTSGDTCKSIPYTTQNYTVTATSVQFGCITSLSKEIVVLDAEPVGIDGPRYICKGNDAILKGKNANHYFWIIKDNDGNEISVEADSMNFRPEKETDYFVVGRDNNGCESKAKHTVGIKESPIATIIDSTDKVCPNEYASVTLMTKAGYTFDWEDGETTTYTKRKKIQDNEEWKVVVTLDGCKDSLSIPVYVYPLPTADIKALPEICAKDTATVSIISESDDVEWLYPNDYIEVNKKTMRYVPNGDISYQVVVKSKEGCVGTRTFEQKVLQPFEVKILAKSAVCSGHKVPLSTESPNIESVKWYANGKHFAFQKETDYTVYEPMKFIVESTDINGCHNKDSVMVDTLPRPELKISGDFEVCKGEVAQLVASGAEEYSWSENGVNKSENSHVSTLMDKDRTTLILEGWLQGCKSEKKAYISTLPEPVIRITGDKIVCPGGKFTLKAKGGVSYKWSTGDEGDETTQTTQIETTYFVTAKDSNGCSGTQPYTMKVYEKPVITIEEKSETGCVGEGEKVTLEANGALFYKWSADPMPSDMEEGHSADKIQTTIFEPTFFYVTGIDDRGCEGKTEKKVVMNSLKEFKFEVSPKWIDESNPTVKLKGVSPVEAEWKWRPSEMSDEHIGRVLTYTYNTKEVADSVLVNVEVRDANNCYYTGQYSLYIWKDIWCPDAFTPNKDETNEKFRFFGGKYIDQFHFIIYNRLGEIMFEGNSFEDAWDGTWNGVEQPWGIYGWSCTYNCSLRGMEKSGEKRGFVTLIR